MLAATNTTYQKIQDDSIKRGKHKLDRHADTIALAEEELKKQKRVYPFRSEAEINTMVRYFLSHKKFMYACIFVMGCNSTLRVSDLIDFRWRDIMIGDTVKDVFSKKERKNGNTKTVYVNDAIKKAVMIYLKSLGGNVDPDSYMFVSQSNHKKIAVTGYKGGVTIIGRDYISEQAVSAAIRGAAKATGLWSQTRKISTHSMRKTAARAAYGGVEGRELPDALKSEHTRLERVQQMMGHTSAAVTARYIDAQDKFNKDTYLWMCLGIEALDEYEKGAYDG